MKRSEINRAIAEAREFFRLHQFALPPFAAWDLNTWVSQPESRVGYLIGNGLGWDVTDYGRGTFETVGLLLFTLRNGLTGDDLVGPGMNYAEKIMMVRKGQRTPMHHHFRKTEDIINRGGGQLAIRCAFTGAQTKRQHGSLNLVVSGLPVCLDHGGTLTLREGESITLPPWVDHEFWGLDGSVLVGEVSSSNDDEKDNCFREPIARFPVIEEDELPKTLTVHDYARLETYTDPANGAR